VKREPSDGTDSVNLIGHNGAKWIKSSLSNANGNCVQVAALSDELIGVRDSKDVLGPVLLFTPAEWSAFVGGLRKGDFDGI
jgi:hypothetical protein